MSKIFRPSEAVIRAINEQEGTVEAIVSDDSIDRHESIFALGCFDQSLDTYRANPVLCWSHPLCSWCEEPDPEDVIGRAETVESRSDGLFCRFRYAIKENERAALIFRLVSSGYLRMYSIAALIQECVTLWSPQESFLALPERYREAIASGAAWEVITRADLFEISQVIVGSNKNANVVAKAFRSGVINRGGLDLLCPDNRIPTGRTMSIPRTPQVSQLAARSADPATEPATDPAPAAPEASPEPEAIDPEIAELENLLEQDPEFAEALAETIEELLEAA